MLTSNSFVEEEASRGCISDTDNNFTAILEENTLKDKTCQNPVYCRVRDAFKKTSTATAV